MSLPAASPGVLRCPTCGASQPWSDSCRRCRSDLSLLHQTLRHARRLRQTCLYQFARQDYEQAARTARRCCALDPSPENHRLLAMAELLRGGFAAAAAIAAEAGGERSGASPRSAIPPAARTASASRPSAVGH